MAETALSSSKRILEDKMFRALIVLCLLIGSSVAIAKTLKPEMVQAQQAQQVQAMTSAQIVAQQIGQLVIQNAQFQERITQLEAEVAALKKAQEKKE
jgi:cyanate permease